MQNLSDIVGGHTDRTLILKSSATDKTETEYHFSIEFYVFQENSSYIAYCPSLDISTCAESYNEAISAFYEMFQFHIECCIENGTLHEDLLAHLPIPFCHIPLVRMFWNIRIFPL